MTSNGSPSLTELSRQVTKEFSFLHCTLLRLDLSTTSEESTKQMQTVADQLVPEVHDQMSLPPIPPHACKSGTAVYYCCNCNNGPQTLTINPFCANCGAKFCSNCTVCSVKWVRMFTMVSALFGIKETTQLVRYSVIAPQRLAFGKSLSFCWQGLFLWLWVAGTRGPRQGFLCLCARCPQQCSTLANICQLCVAVCVLLHDRKSYFCWKQTYVQFSVRFSTSKAPSEILHWRVKSSSIA